MKSEQADTGSAMRTPIIARDSAASLAHHPARLLVTPQTAVVVLASYSIRDGLTLHSLECPLNFPCHACHLRQEAAIVALHDQRLVCPACHALLARSPVQQRLAATPILRPQRVPTETGIGTRQNQGASEIRKRPGHKGAA